MSDSDKPAAIVAVDELEQKQEDVEVDAGEPQEDEQETVAAADDEEEVRERVLRQIFLLARIERELKQKHMKAQKAVAAEIQQEVERRMQQERVKPSILAQERLRHQIDTEMMHMAGLPLERVERMELMLPTKVSCRCTIC